MLVKDDTLVQHFGIIDRLAAGEGRDSQGLVEVAELVLPRHDERLQVRAAGNIAVLGSVGVDKDEIPVPRTAMRARPDASRDGRIRAVQKDGAELGQLRGLGRDQLLLAICKIGDLNALERIGSIRGSTPCIGHRPRAVAVSDQRVIRLIAGIFGHILAGTANDRVVTGITLEDVIGRTALQRIAEMAPQLPDGRGRAGLVDHAATRIDIINGALHSVLIAGDGFPPDQLELVLSNTPNAIEIGDPGYDRIVEQRPCRIENGQMHLAGIGIGHNHRIIGHALDVRPNAASRCQRDRRRRSGDNEGRIGLIYGEEMLIACSKAIRDDIEGSVGLRLNCHTEQAGEVRSDCGCRP